MIARAKSAIRGFGMGFGLGIYVGVIGIAGCAPERAEDPAPNYRRADSPIGSVLAFDPSRALGQWHQVALIGSGCADAQMRLAARGDAIAVTTTCDGAVLQNLWHPDGTGRFVSKDGALWVLWVDQGYRTMVLGVPNGRFGAIWNRDARIPADRLAAAGEVLDFNGYDLRQLRKE